MALSDQLSKLSARAKEAEDRVAAATTEASAELDQEVEKAGESARAQSDELRKTVEADLDAYSAWWAGVQRSWDDHIAEIRRNISDKKAEHDAKAANRRADVAENDAAFAVDFALGAIQEAEYAVLYAIQARRGAEETTAG